MARARALNHVLAGIHEPCRVPEGRGPPSERWVGAVRGSRTVRGPVVRGRFVCQLLFPSPLSSRRMMHLSLSDPEFETRSLLQRGCRLQRERAISPFPAGKSVGLRQRGPGPASPTAPRVPWTPQDPCGGQPPWPSLLSEPCSWGPSSPSSFLHTGLPSTIS